MLLSNPLQKSKHKKKKSNYSFQSNFVVILQKQNLTTETILTSGRYKEKQTLATLLDHHVISKD